MRYYAQRRHNQFVTSFTITEWEYRAAMIAGGSIIHSDADITIIKERDL